MRLCGFRLMRKPSRIVNFERAELPHGHGEPCGAAAACPGLEGGVPRATVSRRVMICIHCRVPHTCSSLTANRNFLCTFIFVLEYCDGSSRRFRGASSPRI